MGSYELFHYFSHTLLTYLFVNKCKHVKKEHTLDYKFKGENVELY